MSLSNTVKAIQDIMRKDAGVDGDGGDGWRLEGVHAGRGTDSDK